MEQLKRRGFPLVTWWSLCKDNGESIWALAYSLPKVWTVWSSSLSASDLVWVAPWSDRDIMSCWIKVLLRKEDEGYCGYHNDFVSKCPIWHVHIYVCSSYLFMC